MKYHITFLLSLCLGAFMSLQAQIVEVSYEVKDDNVRIYLQSTSSAPVALHAINLSLAYGQEATVEAASPSLFHQSWTNYLEAPALYVGSVSLVGAPLWWTAASNRARRAGLILVAVIAAFVALPLPRALLWAGTGDYFRITNTFAALPILLAGALGLAAAVRGEGWTGRRRQLLQVGTLGLLLVGLWWPWYLDYRSVQTARRIQPCGGSRLLSGPSGQPR